MDREGRFDGCWLAGREDGEELVAEDWLLGRRRKRRRLNECRRRGRDEDRLRRSKLSERV